MKESAIRTLPHASQVAVMGQHFENIFTWTYSRWVFVLLSKFSSFICSPLYLISSFGIRPSSDPHPLKWASLSLFPAAQFHTRECAELCTELHRTSRRLKYKAHFLLSQPNALTWISSETWTWIYYSAPRRFIELSSWWSSSSSSSRHCDGNLKAQGKRRIPYLTADSLQCTRAPSFPLGGEDGGQWHIATISQGKDFNYDKHPSPLLGRD